jgi:hypothetical protein
MRRKEDKKAPIPQAPGGSTQLLDRTSVTGSKTDFDVPASGQYEILAESNGISGIRSLSKPITIHSSSPSRPLQTSKSTLDRATASPLLAGTLRVSKTTGDDDEFDGGIDSQGRMNKRRRSQSKDREAGLSGKKKTKQEIPLHTRSPHQIPDPTLKPAFQRYRKLCFVNEPEPLMDL